MTRVSTLILKSVIYLIGLATVALCVTIVGVSVSGNAGIFLPVLIGILITAIPFFYVLYQVIVLLTYIEKNTAFSEASVKAIRIIEYCAFTISALYAAMMPLILSVGQKDDAPGVVLIGLVFITAPLITGVFAAVLQRLLQNAIDIKAENDLTV